MKVEFIKTETIREFAKYTNYKEENFIFAVRAAEQGLLQRLINHITKNPQDEALDYLFTLQDDNDVSLWSHEPDGPTLLFDDSDPTELLAFLEEGEGDS